MADVVIHEVPEKMTLGSLLGTTFLNKQSEKSGEESFRMWITDEANKEEGNKYQWNSALVALKKVTKHREEELEEVKELMDLEDGELLEDVIEDNEVD